MKVIKFLKLIISIIICELAGIIGSFFTASSVSSWYAELAKPQFTPPGWVFAPVWTTLYLLMGVAAFLVWTSPVSKGKKVALIIFAVQLVLNTLWSIIFFGLRSPLGAFIEIIFLWLAILAAIIAFSRISKPAAWLLLPYILWVSFAAYLNYAILKLVG